MSEPTAQDLYREMMNTLIAPVLKRTGFKRKGQAFEKQRNGYNAYIGFQKNRWNTKSQVSFTINLGVVNPEIVEGLARATRRAMGYWGRTAQVIPLCGNWGGRIGHFLGRDDTWWSFETRSEMEEVARSVVAALEDRALPLIERELDRPLCSPSYVIVETGPGPRGSYVNDVGEIVYYQANAKRLWPIPEGDEMPALTGEAPDLRTPPHTWP